MMKMTLVISLHWTRVTNRVRLMTRTNKQRLALFRRPPSILPIHPSLFKLILPLPLHQQLMCQILLVRGGNLLVASRSDPLPQLSVLLSDLHQHLVDPLHYRLLPMKNNRLLQKMYLDRGHLLQCLDPVPLSQVASARWLRRLVVRVLVLVPVKPPKLKPRNHRHKLQQPLLLGRVLPYHHLEVKRLTHLDHLALHWVPIHLQPQWLQE